MMGFRDRFDRSKRKASTRNQRIGFALFWLLVLAYAYVIPISPSFNSESHLYVTFNMVNRGTVNIDAFHRRLGDESFSNGHYYSDKAPGLSFLAVPAYALLKVAFPHYPPQPYDAHGRYGYSIPRNTVYLRYVITYLLVILPSAIFAVLLWLFLAGFVSSGWALILTLAYSLGTTAYSYSMWYYSHQICAILLFGAFLILYYRVRRGEPTKRALVFVALAGLLAGYAVISEYPTVVIAAALGVYLIAVAQQKLRAAIAFAAGMVPAAALGIWYNLATFGKPLATGYNYVHSAMYHHSIHGGTLGLGSLASYGIQAPSWYSLWQITFGLYRGIFLISPVLLLFAAAAPFVWRRRDVRPELLLFVAIVAAYFLMDASRGQDVNGWSGGVSVASRHLVPVLPFMIVPLAFGLPNRRFRVAFCILAAYSVAMMAAINTLDLSGGFGLSDQNPLLNELWNHIVHGHTGINWGYLLGLSGVESLLPLCVIAAVLVSRLLWLFHRMPAVVPRVERVTAALETS